MKVFTVVGARPQFIKAAAVSRLLRNSMTEFLVHTGQHFDGSMSDIFFEQLSIPRPNHNLGIHGGGHGEMTARMLLGLEPLIQAERPDLVLVYGDTNSTLAAALAAAKLNVPVAHIEAGLRSFNMKMPEEINRVLTDRVSTLLFCPTEQAVINLEREGFCEQSGVQVLKVGDVMQDAALFYEERAQMPGTLDSTRIGADFALATVHRAENTDDPVRLRAIISALNDVKKTLPVVLPLHPRTRQRLKDLSIAVDVEVIEPVGYLEMVWLLKNCRLVITDSGGLQKEAWFFRRPCVIMRDETEWVELVQAGSSMLAGADRTAIRNCVTEALKLSPDFDRDLYGGGQAAQRIVANLQRFG